MTHGRLEGKKKKRMSDEKRTKPKNIREKKKDHEVIKK